MSFPDTFLGWVAASGVAPAHIDRVVGMPQGWCKRLCVGEAALPPMSRIHILCDALSVSGPEFSTAAMGYDGDAAMRNAKRKKLKFLRLAIEGPLADAMDALEAQGVANHRDVKQQAIAYILAGVADGGAS